MSTQMNLRDTDILVAGYVRLEIEKKLKMNIPSDVTQICYIYWKPIDIWNEDMIIKTRSIVTNNYNLKQISEATTSVFGTHIVKVNEACWWKLKMKKFEQQINIGRERARGMRIGIIANDEHKLKPLRFTNEWNKHDLECYWYDVDDGSVFEGGWGRAEYGASLTKPGDTLGMYLDLTKNVNTLRFTRNGKMYGKIIYVVPQNYRLAVCFGDSSGTEIEIV